MNTLGGRPTLADRLPTILLALVALASVCAAIALAFYFYNFAGGLSTSTEIWGQFGDYFGGSLNPIFAFLGLIALLLSIYVQALELRHSSEELSKSAEALKQQQESMAQQNFENMFFQMVRLHNDIVSSIDLRTISKSTKIPRVTLGRDCFKVFFRRFSKQANKALRGDYYPLNYADSMAKAYEVFHSENEQNVGHYFRNLYRAFKFISESNLENKRRYSGILRAQLSTHELLLLFYNSNSVVGKKFQRYLEEFELFENMPKDLLINKEEDIALYDLKVFGEQDM